MDYIFICYCVLTGPGEIILHRDLGMTSYATADHNDRITIVSVHGLQGVRGSSYLIITH